jgi:hypothetical protein
MTSHHESLKGHRNCRYVRGPLSAHRYTQGPVSNFDHSGTDVALRGARRGSRAQRYRQGNFCLQCLQLGMVRQDFFIQIEMLFRLHRYHQGVPDPLGMLTAQVTAFACVVMDVEGIVDPESETMV